MANNLSKFYKIGSIGEFSLVIIIGINNTIEEKIYSQDELDDNIIVFSELNNCDSFIQNYLKGI